MPRLVTPSFDKNPTRSSLFFPFLGLRSRHDPMCGNQVVVFADTGCRLPALPVTYEKMETSRQLRGKRLALPTLSTNAMHVSRYASGFRRNAPSCSAPRTTCSCASVRSLSSCAAPRDTS